MKRPRYILVRLDGDKQELAAELCKEFEEFHGVEAAAIVYKGSRYAERFAYTGEFYSTPQANERLL